MFLPNLSALRTGADGDAPGQSAQNEALGIADVIKNILANINAGNFALACETARIWANQICHANREACDDDDAWIKLTASAFKHLKVTPKLLTTEDAAAGHSTMAWFFELCNRASRYTVARARLQDVNRREREYHRQWRELRGKLTEKMPDPIHTNLSGTDKQEAKKLARQLHRLEHNLDDPNHPGIPLRDQQQELRVLVDMLKRSLEADPFNNELLSQLNQAWEASFGSDEPMEEEEGEEGGDGAIGDQD